MKRELAKNSVKPKEIFLCVLFDIGSFYTWFNKKYQWCWITKIDRIKYHATDSTSCCHENHVGNTMIIFFSGRVCQYSDFIHIGKKSVGVHFHQPTQKCIFQNAFANLAYGITWISAMALHNKPLKQQSIKLSKILA